MFKTIWLVLLKAAAEQPHIVNVSFEVMFFGAQCRNGFRSFSIYACFYFYSAYSYRVSVQYVAWHKTQIVHSPIQCNTTHTTNPKIHVCKAKVSAIRDEFHYGPQVKTICFEQKVHNDVWNVKKVSGVALWQLPIFLTWVNFQFRTMYSTHTF